MDPELQRELARWLRDAHGAASDARRFALEQAPHVVREIVALGRAEWTLVAVACLLALSAGVYLIRRAVRAFAAEDYPAPIYVVFAVVGPILAFLAVVLGVNSAHRCLMAWFAPRLYVLDYLTGLVGQMAGK